MRINLRLNKKVFNLCRRNNSRIKKIFKETEPFIDKTIRKLGVYPEAKNSYGMSYHELLSEAYLILLFHIIPSFRRYKGDFSHYSKRFLSREIAKRLYRERNKLIGNVSLFGPEEMSDEDDSEDSKLNYSFGYTDHKPQEIGISIALEKLYAQCDSTERKMLDGIIKDGRFLPLRKCAAKLKISPATLYRKRKELIRKIILSL